MRRTFIPAPVCNAVATAGRKAGICGDVDSCFRRNDKNAIKKIDLKRSIFLNAGDEGIEPSTSLLEREIIPFN